MLVISDASPVNVLIRIELIHVLTKLFGRVVIPLAVANELRNPATPEAIKTFMSSPPDWLVIQSPTNVLLLLGLGVGEQHAISLAHESKADLLLVDDKRGRRAAAGLGIPIVGTLGILELAASKGFVELSEAIDRLRQTDFKISEKLISQALNRRK